MQMHKRLGNQDYNNNKSYVKPTLNKSVTLEGNKNEDGNSANKTQYKKKIIGNCNLSLTKFNEEGDTKVNKNCESVVGKDFECNEGDKTKRRIVLNSLKMLIQTLNEQELKEVKKEEQKTETKKPEEQKALINFETFKKGVIILVSGGFALSFLKNSSFTKNRTRHF